MRNRSYPVLIIVALMLSSLVSASKAFQTGPGGSPSDARYETFGPRASQLVINVYSDYASMFAAFQSRSIDFIDSNLLPADYAAIKDNPAFTTGAVTTFSLREFDLNCYVPPFNSTRFRQGLASLIDRNQYLSTYFPSGGLPAYTPLQAMGSWADPALGPPAYYPQDFAAAYNYFCAAYGSPVPDPNREGYSTWNFPNPYPTTSANPNPTPYPGDGPAVPNMEILFYIRTEQPERQNSGVYLMDQAHNQFPLWAQANQGDPVFTTYPLPVSGNSTLWPELDFYPVYATSATFWVQVMTYYRFQLYTGGWLTSSTPDFLENWLSDNAPQNREWNGAYNYGSFMDTAFDTAETNMEQATVIDPPTVHTTAKYYAYQAQDRLMALAGVIPWWIYSGYSATLTSDYDAINALSIGFGNWYSFLNAYPTSGSPGYGTNTLYWGWQSDIHSNANPISSTWAWDWYLISEIYDSLIRSNPYDTSKFDSSLADNYTVASSPGTVMTVHLRNNVFWQDVPYKDRSAYTMDGGHELDGPFTNVPLTVLDVAFTYMMARDFNYYEPIYISTPTNYYGVYGVNHVSVSSAWNKSGGWSWSGPFAVDPPWWNSTFMLANGAVAWDKNFVQFDPTLDQSTMKIYLDDTTPLIAYSHYLSVSVYPLHIFKYLAEGPWQHNGHAVPDVGAMNMGPIGGANLEYGTGPYIWTGGVAGSNYVMTAYKAGVSYGGITEQNSYFATGHDLAVVNVVPTQRLVLPGATINITVQVKNQGGYSETSNITLYAGSTSIGAHYGAFLNSSETKTFVFSWNTTASPPGCYSLKASVAPVLYEADPNNNNDVNGTVIIGVETPTGTNVAVSPAPNTQVTFDQTTTTGVTTLNVTQPTSTTLTAAASSVFVDIKTNATYSGNVTLQFTYNATGLTLEDERAIRMWLWNQTSNKWVDITTSVDTDNNIVYGVSPHLSMFGITCTLGLTDNNGYEIPTNVATPPSPPPMPEGLITISYFDIQTTESYNPPVTVRLKYDPSTIPEEQALFLKMWVWDGAEWVDITSAVDTANNVIIGVSPHLSMFGITSTRTCATEGVVGLNGYKLMFKETINNSPGSPTTIDYYTSFHTDKWNSVQWVSAGISGSSTLVTGYLIPGQTTIDLPYCVYVMPSSGPNAIKWGDWLKISFTFHWNCSGTSYSVDYVMKLHVHQGDIAGAATVFPYMGADTIVNLLDLNPISFNWNKPVSWTGTFNPLDQLHKADITKDGIINLLDLNPVSFNWGKTWTNTPPPG